MSDPNKYHEDLFDFDADDDKITDELIEKAKKFKPKYKNNTNNLSKVTDKDEEKK